LTYLRGEFVCGSRYREVLPREYDRRRRAHPN
jgi:hypothetical protein